MNPSFSIEPSVPAFVMQGACTWLFGTDPEGRWSGVEIEVHSTRMYSTTSTASAHALQPSGGAEGDRRKFQQLRKQWKAERGATSSIVQMSMCPSYQSIVGMGAIALPFILGELEIEGDGPDQWFWALRAISGADPVQEGDRGDFIRMARTWLNWGRARGYIG